MTMAKNVQIDNWNLEEEVTMSGHLYITYEIEPSMMEVKR